VDAMPGSSVVELFRAVRKEIMGGYRLITHPLTGSMGPDRNPYKSIMLAGLIKTSYSSPLISNCTWVFTLETPPCHAEPSMPASYIP
jgi:hypothetical protein